MSTKNIWGKSFWDTMEQDLASAASLTRLELPTGWEVDNRAISNGHLSYQNQITLLIKEIEQLRSENQYLKEILEEEYKGATWNGEK